MLCWTSYREISWFLFYHNVAKWSPSPYWMWQQALYLSGSLQHSSVCQNSSNSCNSKTYVRWRGLMFAWKWAHGLVLWLLSHASRTFWAPSVLQHPGSVWSRTSGTPICLCLMCSSSLHQLQNRRLLEILAYTWENLTKNDLSPKWEVPKQENSPEGAIWRAVNKPGRRIQRAEQRV